MYYIYRSYEPPHFSRQVFPVQSAYSSAAGSSLARKPTSTGALLSFDRPSRTSATKVLAIEAAKMTLQAGEVSEVEAMVIGACLELMFGLLSDHQMGK